MENCYKPDLYFHVEVYKKLLLIHEVQTTHPTTHQNQSDNQVVVVEDSQFRLCSPDFVTTE